MLRHTLSLLAIAIAIPCLGAAETPNTPEWTLCQLIEQAQHCNGDVAAAHSEVCAYESGLWEGLASYSPSIGATTGSVKEDIDVRNESYGFGYLYANWNLFRGGADRARLCERQVQHLRAQHALCATLKQVSYKVARAYYELLYLEQAIAHHTDALDAGQHYIKIANRKQESGLTTELDVVEFELQGEEMRAERDALEGEASAARELLAALIGDCAFDTTLAPATLNASISEDDPCTLLEIARCHRDDWRDAVLAESEERHRTQQAFGEFLPSVDIYASYGTEPNIDADRGHGGKAMVSVTVPIFSGGARYRRHQQSRRLVNAACHRAEQIERTVFGEIKAAASRLATAHRKYEAVQRRKAVIERYWTMTRDEYQRGVRNSADLANAASQFTHWRVQMAAAERDLALADVAMSAALGKGYCEGAI